MAQQRGKDDELTTPIARSTPAAPGKSTSSARLTPRPIVFRVDSAAAARELASSFGRRDDNGVAAGADAVVQRAASSSSGAPLPADVRGRFEASTGADLSSVRVHTGGASADAASAVGARAYTTGQDIHFGAGQYAPQDPFGLHLLAHEVAHTVQQQGGAARTQYKLEVSSPGDGAEVEADRAADAMVHGAPAAIATAPAAVARDYQAPGSFSMPSISIGMGLPPAKPLTDEDRAKIAKSKETFDEQMGYLRDLIGDISLQQINAASDLKTEVPKEEELSLGGTLLKMGVEAAVGFAAGAIASKLAGKLVGELMEDEAIKKVVESAIEKGQEAAKTKAGGVVESSLKETPDSDAFFNALKNSYPAQNDPARQAFDGNRKAMWERQKLSVESADRAAKAATDMHAKAGAALTKELVYTSTKHAAIDQWAVILAQLKEGTAAAKGDKDKIGTDMSTAASLSAYKAKGVLYLTIKIEPGDKMVLGGATIHGIGDKAIQSAMAGRTVRDLNIPKQITADFQGEWGLDNLFHEQSTYFRAGMNEKGVVWLGDTYLDAMEWLKKRGGGDAYTGVFNLLDRELGGWVPTFT